MKGSDRARADVLVRAAQSLDYQCYFALLTLHQEGSAEYGSYEYRSRWDRRRSSWSDDNEDDEDKEDEEGDDDEGEFEEIFEEELTLEHWLDPEGREQSFGTIPFDENEILGLQDKEDWTFKQTVHEATGNEGASMDRWYRQASVVIWPGEHHFFPKSLNGAGSWEGKIARGIRPCGCSVSKKGGNGTTCSSSLPWSCKVNRRWKNLSSTCGTGGI